MDLRFLLLSSAFLCTVAATACDVCGVFIGITPQDRRSSIGLYHRYRLLEGDLDATSLLKHGDAHQEAVARYREGYSSLEVRADLWLHTRLAVLVSVPVVQNVQRIDGAMSAHASGIGDPFVLARYAVINTGQGSTERRAMHRLSIGGGVKFPLGENHQVHNGEVVDHDLQPGSGSWDWLGSLEYRFRKGRWGGSLQSIARWNGENADGMSSGTGLSSSLEISRGFDSGSVQLWPFIGTYHERMALDHHHGEPIDGTGCNTLFAQTGARLWWKRWALSMTGQFAVASNDGELMLPNRFRSVVGLSFFLGANGAGRADAPDRPLN